MGLLSGVAVRPTDENVVALEEQVQVAPKPWYKRHPYLAGVLATTLILGAVAAVVVPTVCVVHGCPPKEEEAQVDPYTSNAPKRIIISFVDQIDAIEVVPPLLRAYATQLALELSNLQILDLVDDDILQIVIDEIKKRTDVEFWVRDFNLWAPKDPLTQSQPAGSGRRLLQQQPNDPQLSLQWWFDRINVTGAWAQAGNVSNVIVAVTDSGAQLDHPDLAGSFWVNPGEIPGNGVDDDKNGIVDDINGAIFAGRNCSFSYSGYNASRCGNPTDRVGHGTRIGGIIAAQANNGIGIAGVGPNLRHMVLKVTDETADPFNPPYAYSDVVRAVDYGVKMGAKIFSMSFGDHGRQSKQAMFKPQLDAAANAYKTLFRKYDPYGVLFVAASGNEWTDLDTWRRDNYTYSPCMVDAPNVLCVGATDASERPMHVIAGNMEGGTNYGMSSVDMAAPGLGIQTTDLASGYANASGTSYACPMTAAVAGLVLGVLGSSNVSAVAIKEVLMNSGPLVEGLPFKSSRRLDAARAISTANTLVTGRYLLQTEYALSRINTTVLSRQFDEEYWFDTRRDGQFDTINMQLTDTATRDARTTKFWAWEYTSGDYLVINRAMMRLTQTGLYRVRSALTSIKPDKYQLVVGDRQIINMTSGSADLMIQSPGWYSFELWAYPQQASVIELTWTTPFSSAWGPLNEIIFSYSQDNVTVRDYDPQVQPKPQLYHVVFNQSRDYGLIPRNVWQTFSPASVREVSTTVPDLSYGTPAAVRAGLYNSGLVPTNGTTAIFGFARANLRPQTFAKPMAFRVQCTHCRLLVNGKMLIDHQSDQSGIRVSACVTLRNNTAYEMYLYFATRLGNVLGPLTLMWAPCADGRTPPANQTLFTSLRSSIATDWHWQPAAVSTDTPRGLRCDAWPHNSTGLDEFAIGLRPAYGQPSTYSWILPRDCAPENKTADGECAVNMSLRTFFPSAMDQGWFIRCWTYWAAGFRSGVARVTGINNPAQIHLAGRQVHDMPGNGISWSNWAPLNTTLTPQGAVYQLAVVEWLSRGTQWSPIARLGVMDGSEVLNWTGPNVWTTRKDLMVLPASAASTTPRRQLQRLQRRR